MPPAPHDGSPGAPKHAPLPTAAVGRMSLYLRELMRMQDAGLQRVSSRELGARLNVSPDVVRRDLAALGSVGRRGVGYTITTLVQRLGQLLGGNTRWRVILIGTGSLGHALLRYRGFGRLGFELVGALDIDRRRIGSTIDAITIEDAANLDLVVARLQPQLAIIAVPADAASEVATRLARCGVAGILNFAPIPLKLPTHVGVVNVDLASELQRLAFAVRYRGETGG